MEGPCIHCPCTSFVSNQFQPNKCSACLHNHKVIHHLSVLVPLYYSHFSSHATDPITIKITSHPTNTLPPSNRTNKHTQHHAAPRSTTQHHAASRSITQHHAASRSITQHHAASRSIMQHHNKYYPPLI